MIAIKWQLQSLATKIRMLSDVRFEACVFPRIIKHKCLPCKIRCNILECISISTSKSMEQVVREWESDTPNGNKTYLHSVTMKMIHSESTSQIPLAVRHFLDVKKTHSDWTRSIPADRWTCSDWTRPSVTWSCRLSRDYPTSKTESRAVSLSLSRWQEYASSLVVHWSCDMLMTPSDWTRATFRSGSDSHEGVRLSFSESV